jgi:hypothetical protein
VFECKTSFSCGTYRSAPSKNRSAVASNSVLLRVVVLGVLACTALDALASPIASEDYVSTAYSTTVVIDVLENDYSDDYSDDYVIDPSSVEITSGPAHGSVQFNPVIGLVFYTPATGFSGEDSFEYRVSDTSGQVSNTTTVYLIVDANQIPIIESVSTTYTSSELLWTVTGTVNDEMPSSLDLKVDGDAILVVVIDDEGKFEFTLSGPPNREFDLLLKAVDEENQQSSDVYEAWLYPYF